MIALPHPALLAVSAKLGHPLTDTWCMKLAALHLKHMLETGEDMEKTLVTMQPAEIEQYARELQDSLASHSRLVCRSSVRLRHAAARLQKTSSRGCSPNEGDLLA